MQVRRTLTPGRVQRSCFISVLSILRCLSASSSYAIAAPQVAGALGDDVRSCADTAAAQLEALRLDVGSAMGGKADKVGLDRLRKPG